MIGAALSLIAFTVVIFTYLEWLNEQRKKSTRHPKGYVNNRQFSRQSLRYHESTLFDIVFAAGVAATTPQETFEAFVDRFRTQADVMSAIRKAGIHSCSVIIAIDFTASNEWQGRRTFHRQNLHSILAKGQLNPYQLAITALAPALEPLRMPPPNNDQKTPAGRLYAFGFGDENTRDRAVFELGKQPCDSFDQVLQRYTEHARKTELAGPTNFTPILKEAMKIVKSSNFKYHILVMIGDGQMDDDMDTVDTIVKASDYPLSIVMAGVGDGPWDRMEEYDDLLPQRRFDNFQFVDYSKAVTVSGRRRNNAQAAFALSALMEIPDQYRTIRKLGLMHHA